MRADFPVRPVTADLRMSHVRWGASSLVLTGVPLPEITALSCLLTPLTRAHDILRYHFRAAGKKPSARGMHVAEVLLMIAKHYLKLPEEALAQIREWAKPVRLKYHGMTEKNEVCVQNIMGDPARELRLRELPSVYLKTARSLLMQHPRKACSRALAAALIKLLNDLAERGGEIRGLRLDQHLQRADPRRGLITHINIPPTETKNKKVRHIRIQPETGQVLEAWITTFRPHVAAPGCPYLFPGWGTGHQPIGRQGLRDAVKRATREYVGVTLSPHQFRHLNANIILDELEGQYTLVQRYLNHASVETTMRSYCGSEAKSAGRCVDAAIFNRRQRLQRKPPSNKPKGLPSQRGNRRR
jgi:integrase